MGHEQFCKPQCANRSPVCGPRGRHAAANFTAATQLQCRCSAERQSPGPLTSRSFLSVQARDHYGSMMSSIISPSTIPPSTETHSACMFSIANDNVETVDVDSSSTLSAYAVTSNGLAKQIARCDSSANTKIDTTSHRTSEGAETIAIQQRWDAVHSAVPKATIGDNLPAACPRTICCQIWHSATWRPSVTGFTESVSGSGTHHRQACSLTQISANGCSFGFINADPEESRQQPFCSACPTSERRQQVPVNQSEQARNKTSENTAQQQGVRWM